MNRWKAAHVLFVVIVCTLLAFGYYTAESMENKIMGILLGISLLGCAWTSRNKHKRSLHREKTEQKLEIFEWLHHRRHEWLNELQVLYGYIKLNKPQSLLPRLDRLHEKLQQESQVSRLDQPEFVWHLHRLISCNQKFEIEFEAEESFSFSKLGKDDHFFTSCIMKMIDAIERCAEFEEHDHPQSLTIHLDTYEKRLCCRLYYEGNYDFKQLESLVHFLKLKMMKKKPDFSVIHKLEERYAFCEMSLPFRP